MNAIGSALRPDRRIDARNTRRPRLLTVIVNWRTPVMTIDAAAAALGALEGIEGALVIVDNGSGDGSFDRLSAEVRARGWDRGPQRVRVLQAGHNGGFGAGNNLGMSAGLPDGSRPDYVYLLNSDAFPERDAIRALLDHLEANPKVAFAGSRLHGPGGEPHPTAFRFPSILGEFESHLRLGIVSRLLRRSVVSMPMPTATMRVDWTAGASLMFRQDVLDRVGSFDEAYFLYFEETDLCHRAVRAGWSGAYVVESRVMHIGSASTGMKTWSRIPQFWLDSRLRYYSSNHGRIYAALATLAAVIGGGLYRARLLIERRKSDEPDHYLRDLVAHHLRHGFARRTGVAPLKPPALAGQGRDP